jgi:tetratricopeptide (TPR) repeat protein
MNPLFTKFFWKLHFRRKKAEWNVFLIESKKQLSKNKFKYLLWLLKRNPKNSRFAVKKVKKRWLFYKPRYIGIFLKSSKKPRWAIIGFSFILVSILGTILVMVSFPLLKELKFHRFEKTSRTAFQNGDYSTALLTAQTCYIIKPDKIESLKRLVSAAEKLKHPRLWEWGKKLSEHPYSSKNNKVEWIERCINSRDFDSAKEALKTLSEAFPNDENTIYFSCLLEKYKQDERATFRAFTMAQEYLNDFPESERILTFYWDISLSSDQTYLFEQGLESLRKNAELKNNLGKLALRRLLQIPNLSTEERKVWASKMWKMKNPSLLDAVLCLHASYGNKHIGLNSFLFILGQEFETLVREESEEDLASILNRIGRPEMTQELLKLKKVPASENKQIFKNTIRSALQKGKSDLVSELLLTCRASMTPNEQDFFSYLIAQHNKEEKNKDIQKLLKHSSTDELESFRQFLSFFDNPAFLIGYLEEINSRDPTHQGIKYLLATCYQRIGNFKKLKNIVERTYLPNKVRLFSGEQQTCLLKALYQIDLKNCRKWAEDAVRKYPMSQSARYTLALCYLRFGNPESAQEILRSQLLSQPPLCPTQRIIGSTVLLRNNLSTLAMKWAPTENKNLLIDCELEMLAEVLAVKP